MWSRIKTTYVKLTSFSCLKKVSPNKTKMTPDTNFESMFFNRFATKECFVDNYHDPDVNFYHDVSMLDTQYLMPDKFKTNFKDFSKVKSEVQIKISKLSVNFSICVYGFMKHGQVRKT